MKEKIYSSLKFLLLMTILTGVIYPLFMTLIAQIFFSDKANGSLYRINGEVRGSFLLSQNFTLPLLQTENYSLKEHTSF